MLVQSHHRMCCSSYIEAILSICSLEYTVIRQNYVTKSYTVEGAICHEVLLICTKKGMMCTPARKGQITGSSPFPKMMSRINLILHLLILLSSLLAHSSPPFLLPSPRLPFASFGLTLLLLDILGLRLMAFLEHCPWGPALITGLISLDSKLRPAGRGRGRRRGLFIPSDPRLIHRDA